MVAILRKFKFILKFWHRVENIYHVPRYVGDISSYTLWNSADFENVPRRLDISQRSYFKSMASHLVYNIYLKIVWMKEYFDKLPNPQKFMQ